MIREFLPCLIISICMLTAFEINAQTNDWRNYIEQMAEEDMDDTSIENMFEELSFIEQNPFNLNVVTREELERFPLISANQANAISDFLEKNRPIYTVFELRNVYILDYSTVELILTFFYVGEMIKKKQS